MAARAKDITVLIADRGGREAPLFEVMKAWTEGGVLTDTLWLDRDSDGTQAVLVSSDGSGEVNLIEELADRQVATLHVLDVNLVPDDAAARTAPSASDDRDRLLKPIADRAVRGGRDVVSATVIVPASGVPFPEQAHDPLWGLTLLVVPEDRAGDDHVPADVEPDDLGSHAAATCATLVGLWIESGEPLLDLAGLRAGGRGGVHVVRSLVRFADGGGLVDEVADKVLTVHHGWPLPDGVIPPARMTDQPERVAADLADDLIEKHGLGFVATPAPAVPEPRRMPFLQGLGLFFRTFVSILRAAPVWYVERARQKVEKSLLDYFQGWTYGEDSAVVLTLRGQTAGQSARPSTAEAIYDAAVNLRLPGTSAAVAEPVLWSDLTTTSTGMVDAGELPEQVTPPVAGAARLVVSDPRLVAPSPIGHDAVFKADELGPGRTIRPTDPKGAADLRWVLESQAHYADRVGDTGSEASARLEQLAAWMQQRSGTLTWRIGVAVSGALSAASMALAGALEILARGEPSLAEDDRDRLARRRLRRTLVLLSVLLVAAIVGAIYAVREGLADPLPVIGAVVVTAIVLLVIAVVTFIGVVFRLILAQFARARGHSAWLHAHERARESTQQVTRFSALYWQLMDWSDVVGAVVNRPWGPPRGAPTHPAALPDNRPRAVQVGTATISGDGVQGLVSRGQKVVITKGWLGALLDELVRASTARYVALTTSDPDESVPGRDTTRPGQVVQLHSETGEEIRAPRGSLYEAVMKGRFTSELRTRRADEIATSILTSDLDGMYERVTVPGNDPTTPTAFFGGLAPAQGRSTTLPYGLFRDQSMPEHSKVTVYAAPPQVAADGEPRTEVRHRQGDPLVFTGLRLDVSRAVPLEGLVTIGPEPLPGTISDPIPQKRMPDI